MSILLASGVVFVAAETTAEPPSQLPSSVITPPAAPSANGWHIAFGDEFDDDVFDDGKWITCDTGFQYENGCASVTNGTLAIFQPDDVIEQDGVVRLRAQQRDITASDGTKYAYTSGMLSSKDKYQFQYGYMEMRARVPQGRAMWPSFFTLPAVARYFPPEIDVLELLGNDTTRAYLTYHYDGQQALSVTRTVQSVYEYQPGFHDGFHTYAVDWQPGVVIWYVDGIERFRTSDRITKEPHKVLAQLAVGINWQDNNFVDMSTQIPSYYDIDYIRIWKRGPTPASLFEGFDDAIKIHASSNNARVNLEPKQQNSTGRLSRNDNKPAWTVWHLENTAVATATVLYWPGESFKPVKFFTSSDNAVYSEATPQILSDGGDWRRIEYRINMPSGSSFIKLVIPETVQPFSIQVASLGMTRASNAPTPTPRPPKTATPAPTALPSEWWDELNDMSGLLSRSSRLRLETIFPERFAGDDTRLIRWSLDNEWAQWRVRSGAPTRVTTYHWQGEPIKNFTFLSSTNNITYAAIIPISVTQPTSDPQWVQIDYTFDVPLTVNFLRAVFPRNNYNHTPQIGRVRTSTTNFPNATPTPAPPTAVPPTATLRPGQTVVVPTVSPEPPQPTIDPARRKQLWLPAVSR